MHEINKINENVNSPLAIAGESVPPGILPDHTLRDLSLNHDMISPFEEKQKCEGMISYGLSSYGYDARLAPEFMIFTNVDNALVDPKNFSEKSFAIRNDDECVIPP